jgi:hypothetical protein
MILRTGTDMPERTEWEIVDEPASPGARRTKLPQMLLGRWWKWKLVGVLLAAGSALLLITALAGAFMLLMSFGAVTAILAARLKLWWDRRHGGRPAQDISSRPA